MASLFDILSGSPEQAQGLLGLASGLLQAGGPSRMPVGLGQAFGLGLQGYQQGVDQYRQREQQKMQNDLQTAITGFKLRDMQSDFDNQERQRARSAEVEKFTRNYLSGGGQQGASNPLSVLGGNAAPTIANAEKLSAANPMQAGAPTRQSSYERAMAFADALRGAGFGAEADAAEERALKRQPKVKAWEKVNVDGKTLFAPYFEDGTSGSPVPYSVAEKLEKVNRGGTTDLIDPYSGKVVSSMTNTQSPDSAASVAATIRGQNMTDARQREANNLKYAEIANTKEQKVRDENLAKQGQIASFDTMLGTLDRLKAHPGLSRSVGLYSKVPTIPGSDSANFQAELETFKSQAFIPAVAQLKGMGALSDAEGKKLSAAVGALDPSMSEEEFTKSINRIISDMNAAKSRVLGSSRPSVRESMGQSNGGIKFLGFE
jgi:hypothetical protein